MVWPCPRWVEVTRSLGFLAGREMQRAAHERLLAERGAERGHPPFARLLGGVLERADARHRAIEGKQALGPARGHGVR
jgi:hypothetical protein